MAGKMLVERTIFCLWRAGRDVLPRRGPDRGKRMGIDCDRAGPGQGKGAQSMEGQYGEEAGKSRRL